MDDVRRVHEMEPARYLINHVLAMLVREGLLGFYDVEEIAVHQAHDQVERSEGLLSSEISKTNPSSPTYRSDQ